MIKIAVCTRNNTKSFSILSIELSSWAFFFFINVSLWVWKSENSFPENVCSIVVYYFTGSSVTIIVLHIPKAASQMNEMKLNKFMIFVRYVCTQFRAFRSSQTKLQPLNRNKHFAISIALFITLCNSWCREKVSLLYCVLAKAIHLLLWVRFSINGREIGVARKF